MQVDNSKSSNNSLQKKLTQVTFKGDDDDDAGDSSFQRMVNGVGSNNNERSSADVFDQDPENVTLMREKRRMQVEADAQSIISLYMKM